MRPLILIMFSFFLQQASTLADLDSGNMEKVIQDENVTLYIWANQVIAMGDAVGLKTLESHVQADACFISAWHTYKNPS